MRHSLCKKYPVAVSMVVTSNNIIRSAISVLLSSQEKDLLQVLYHSQRCSISPAKLARR